ncbi:MAG: Hpt domain-containing protein [Pseudomonadales bacterium]
MSQEQEHFALDWIRGDLLETLDSARAALEEFSDQQDETRMRVALTALHQVHGTLVMLELPGVALLADHLERLAQALMQKSAMNTDEAIADLMQGVLELPGYIDAIHGGQADSERPVIPLVNQVRIHLGMEPLNEPAPNLLEGSASDSAQERFEGIQGIAKARKIRGAYQQVLLSILKGDDRAQAVTTLAKVAQGLFRICDDTPHANQWQALGEFVKSLERQSGPLDAEAIKLLRRVDAEIRKLATTGVDALKNPVNKELIEQLLAQAEEREHSSQVMTDLKSAVHEGVPIDSLAISGRQALASAALALRDEVSQLKDQIDLDVRSEEHSKESFGNLVTPLTQIGNTLSLLGFQSSHSSVFDQIDSLNECMVHESFSQKTLVDVAEALVKVDENLASATQGMRGMGEGERITNEAHRAVAVEARNGLENVKTAIVDYVSSGWDYQSLTAVPAALDEVCGALDMIPLARPARQLGEARRYIVDVLPHQHPDWQSLDHLADAISGVDYYLERIIQENSTGVDGVLDLVDRSLGSLDYGVAKAATEQALADEQDNAEASIVVEPSEHQAVLVQGAAADTDGAEDSDAAVAAPADQFATESLDDVPADQVGAVIGVDDLPKDEETAFAMQSFGEAPEEGFDLGSDDFAFEQPLEESAAVAPSASSDSNVARDAAVGAIATAAVSAVVAGLADEHQGDDEIAEIFAEEAGEVVEQIDHWLPEWRKDLGHEEAMTELRRAFHTLKGSGRMVGANVVGEAAWSVENMLNRVLDNTVVPTAQFADVAGRCRDLVPNLIACFEEQRTADLAPVGQVIEDADLLSSGGELEDTQPAVAAAPITPEEPVAEAPALEEPELNLSEDITEAVAASEPEADLEPAFDEHSAEPAVDETLLLFADEAREHLATLRASMTGDLFDANEDAVRALHTLAGSAGIAGADALLALARPAYEVGRAVRSSKSLDDTIALQVAGFMHQYVDVMSDSVEALGHGEPANIDSSLASQADTLLDAIGDANEAHALLSIEGLSQLFEAPGYLEQWQAGGQDLAFAEQLSGTLERLSERAVALDHPQLAEFGNTLNNVHLKLQDMPLAASSADTLRSAHDELLVYLDALVAEQAVPDLEPCLAALMAILSPARAEPAGADAPTFEAAEESFDLESLGITGETPAQPTESVVASSDPEPEPVKPSPALTEAVPSAAAQAADGEPSSADREFDLEITEIFVEEADELLESMEQSIHVLGKERDNHLHVENMLRDLHTMKGGARLATLSALGDYTHDFETEVLEHQSAGGAAADSFMDLLHERHDTLTSMVASVKSALESGGAGMATCAAAVGMAAAGSVVAAAADSSSTQAPAEFESLTDLEVDADSATDASTDSGADNVVPLVAQAAAQQDSQAPRPKPATRVATPAQDRSSADRASQEMVRVGAGLLEELVNLAGESSIMRARIEQGMGDFTGALDEMETTIGRVREQLRRLEIETEAQILFRQERFDVPAHEDFDPLEMDRYSQLQQLSRSLSESASDMLDLKDTLLFKARESETLLLQQARINTELQEGLMRTRMVPFSRLLPRLRKTVRQVSDELGKDVEFNAYNAEGELDRNLLERMIPPLEHMLRNAVDHGIESAAERSAFGKADTGQVELRLSREGGDVLIEISDDGAGIDVESVRAKAVERGLMDADSDLSDDEVLQFVLAAGFSTAKSVTQISGRGVGMDVVHSEVKQLGGSISISSKPGKGTRFALRLPFTVSVNRALMVSVGDDLYAIPLNTIEGIVLLGPQELEKLYAPGANPFEYAGMSYHVRYLGHFLGREYRGNVSQSSAPVVLVRSGEQSIAVHVDSVQGSREIVVKSLGPQFAGVGGISGATILGDGSVVVILDLLALIRSRGEQPRLASKRNTVAESRTRCVMVVDDSVTVRKVTSRLLERQGMDVLVAKDGVEAVAMLQERRPDILLLDIEMPRMDGFEVARQVRHDDHLDGLPIVMISSRTGEKHQERATGLGVNRFLGKPFQESELLETIDQLVKS